MLTFLYQSKLPLLKHIQIAINYELYDGLPLIVKWIAVTNHQNKPIVLNQAINETLATVEEESAVVGYNMELISTARN